MTGNIFFQQQSVVQVVIGQIAQNMASTYVRVPILHLSKHVFKYLYNVTGERTQRVQVPHFLYFHQWCFGLLFFLIMPDSCN